MPVTNLQRACSAEIALFAYNDEKATTSLRPLALYDLKQSVLTDLLCDLMHYARLDAELDFETALAQARDHHAAEFAEETP